MGESKQILDLYDSLLGKFSFARKFIRALLLLEEDIGSLSLRIDLESKARKSCLDDVSVLEERVKNLEQELSDLRLSISKSGESRDLGQTSASILDSYYDANVKDKN